MKNSTERLYYYRSRNKAKQPQLITTLLQQPRLITNIFPSGRSSSRKYSRKRKGTDEFSQDLEIHRPGSNDISFGASRTSPPDLCLERPTHLRRLHQNLLFLPQLHFASFASSSALFYFSIIGRLTL